MHQQEDPKIVDQHESEYSKHSKDSLFLHLGTIFEASQRLSLTSLSAARTFTPLLLAASKPSSTFTLSNLLTYSDISSIMNKSQQPTEMERFVEYVAVLHFSLIYL